MYTQPRAIGAQDYPIPTSLSKSSTANPRLKWVAGMQEIEGID
jgi:hypothetical protein